MEKNYLHQIKRLTAALIISGALNITLLVSIFYWAVKDTHPAPYFELKPAKIEEQQASIATDQSNSELIRLYRTYTFDQLVHKLSNSELVENGYTQRDLALACLVAFHQFDLNRALAGQNTLTQQRQITYGKRPNGTPVEIAVYKGIDDAQFDAILSFAKTERWPMTAKGLFLLLQKKEAPQDQTLVDAFVLTPEFIAVDTLFKRSEATVDKTELLNVLVEANWKELSDFSEQQKVSQDLSPARRQRFLLDYIEHGSKSAAYLILKTDGPFAAKKFDDHHILKIIALLDEKTPEAEKFTLALLASPRGDIVWQKAGARLYGYAGEEQPEKFQYQDVLLRFFPQRKINKTIEKPKIIPIATPAKDNAPKTVKAPKPVKALSKIAVAAPVAITTPKKERTHTVLEGDNLYRISKKYKVDVEALRKLNRLESNNLKTGMVLRIPS